MEKRDLFDIKEELKKVPGAPGVYLYKDEFGQIIYVGKAVNLSRRMHSYFRPSESLSPKVRAMVSHIAEFEYITAGSEIEALILECNLIKKHRPKYNIILRDDKTYPYIKVTLFEKFPRLLKTRRVVSDGSKYFGPFPEAGAVNTVIDLLNSVYSLKRCGKTEFGKGFKPCLNYHIHACRGICAGEVDEKAYAADIEKVMRVLAGKTDELLKSLKEKMDEASKAMEYEKASELKGYIGSLRDITEKQRVVLSRREDIDALLISEGESGAAAALFTVRDGKLSGRERLFLGEGGGLSKSKMLAEFINSYYRSGVMIPKEILVSERPEDSELLEKFLTREKGSSVKISIPERGERRALLELAQKDFGSMEKSFGEKSKRAAEKEASVQKSLSHLIGRANIGNFNRIEAYDISDIYGFFSVGAMVVFKDGAPFKTGYRRFRIKTVMGADDAASLREMLYRRFKRAAEGDPGFSELPDLILMDGGTAQVNAAKNVLRGLGIEIPICGMVKDDKHRTRALLYEGSEHPLKEDADLFVFLGKIQEEVHRFAIDYHTNLREKSLGRSVLDDIKGIGEKRKAALFKAFGSIDAISRAGAEKLTAVPGMTAPAARAVAEYFACKKD